MLVHLPDHLEIPPQLMKISIIRGKVLHRGYVFDPHVANAGQVIAVI